jgi:SAM-dependent methyltransferase
MRARDLFYRAVIQAQRVYRRRGWPPRLQGRGIEIGAYDRPMPGLRAWYVDRHREFAGRRCPADVIADAACLPFRDSSLDFVACSHVLEHLANPVRAIAEWYRVVKDGGVLYMLVPDRRLTFDRRRDRTPVRHLLEDFERGTSGADATHIDEFFDRVELRELNPALGKGDVESFRETHRAAHHQAARSGQDVDIHHHVFEKRDVIDLLEALRRHPGAMLQYELVEERSFFPPDAGNGFLVAIRPRKGRR